MNVASFTLSDSNKIKPALTPLKASIIDRSATRIPNKFMANKKVQNLNQSNSMTDKMEMRLTPPTNLITEMFMCWINWKHFFIYTIVSHKYLNTTPIIVSLSSPVILIHEHHLSVHENDFLLASQTHMLHSSSGKSEHCWFKVTGHLIMFPGWRQTQFFTGWS